MESSTARFIQPDLASRFPQLVIAQSTRQGGVSPAPFSSLNLGLHTEDKLENAIQNRTLLCESLGINPSCLAGGHQVHGAEVRVVKTPGQASGCDAFITDTPDIFLSVTIADCTPVLLYDPITQSVGAAHAGWRGTVAKIASKTLRAMWKHFGTNPANCYAYIGTCISAEDYEVDADVADHFEDAYKRWDSARQKYFLDLKRANKDDLVTAGIPAAQIEVSPYSTVADNELFFSYRREGVLSGRGLGVIGVAPSVLRTSPRGEKMY